MFIYDYIWFSIYRSINLKPYLSIIIFHYLWLSIIVYPYQLLSSNIYLAFSIQHYLAVFIIVYHCLQSLSIFIYLYLSLCIYLYIAIYRFLSLSISIYIYLSLSIYIHIYLHWSLCLSTYLSLSISISISISIYLPVYLSILSNLSLSIPIPISISIYRLYLGYDGYVMGRGEHPPSIGLIADQGCALLGLGLGRLRSRHLRQWISFWLVMLYPIEMAIKCGTLHVWRNSRFMGSVWEAVGNGVQ